MECKEIKGAGDCNEIVAKFCPYKECAAGMLDKIKNSTSEKSAQVAPKVPDVKKSKIE